MNHYFFYGGICSQWLPCEFEVDGVKYNCAEQYMMACKARVFNDEESLQKIMEADHPRDQKALGRKVKNFNEAAWNRVARDFVYEGNYAKFTQNEGLKLDLFSTGDALLVEASPYDKIWGIGMGEFDDDRHDPAKWKGTNWLGEVITKVREDIRAGVKTTDHNWSDNA